MLVASLTACSDTGDPLPTRTPTGSPTPSASASPEAPAGPTEDEPPELLPGGTALANKVYFDYTNRAFFNRRPGARSPEIVDLLTSAGFAKTDIEITKDTTPTGRRTEAIEFAVRAHDDCLIGQWGKNRYTSYITDVLSNGRCLIGDTLPIN